MGRRKDTQLALVLGVSSAAAGFYFSTAWGTQQLDVFSVASGVILSMISLVALDLLLLWPADSHSVTTLLSQYSMIIRMRLAWFSCVRRWYITSRDPAKAQEETLLRILRENHTSDHGKQYHLHRFKSRSEFAASFPLTDYTHYAEYVDRIGQGAQHVLTGDEVVFLATTSGTTGKHKVYPLTRGYMDEVKRRLFEVNSLKREYYTLKRVHQFRLASIDHVSPCGLKMGGAGVISQYPPPYNLTPRIYLSMYTEHQSYFTQALFILADPELGFLLGYSSTLMYAFFKYMKHTWGCLCDVIESGQIGDVELFDETVRVELGRRLVGNPSRADYLRTAMHEGVDGLASRVWPDLDSVVMAKTGSFKHCADILAKSYLKGVKMFYTRHASTEGFIGLSLGNDTEQDVFTLQPDLSVLEFIEISDVDSPIPKTYFMEELEKDKSYELVLTSPHGIYRYRLGDIIKVVGYYNAIPKYVFQYRLGERLNIAFDRTPDQLVYRALMSSVTRLPDPVSIVDFSATESFNVEQVTGKQVVGNCYVVFVEVLHTSNEDYTLPSDFAYAVDCELQTLHEPYAMYRDKGNISNMELIQVRRDAFNALKVALWGDNPHSQFKMPHVVRREHLIRVLIDFRVRAQ